MDKYNKHIYFQNLRNSTFKNMGSYTPLNKVTSFKAFSAGTVAITQRRKSRHRSITAPTQSKLHKHRHSHVRRAGNVFD